MNCRECAGLLEEYLDQELDPRVTAAVELHMAGCRQCSGEMSNLCAEQAVYQRYDSEVEVRPELWTSIESHLVRKPALSSWLGALLSAPRFSLPATAALVIVAVVLTIAFMKRESSSPKSVAINNPQPAVNSESKAEPVVRSSDKTPRIVPARRQQPVLRPRENRTPDQLVRDAEKKYLAAIAMLSRDVARRKSDLDPKTRMKLEQALHSIDRTIAATRRVVRENPNDPVAANYMLSAYARKVDALREMAGGGL